MTMTARLFPRCIRHLSASLLALPACAGTATRRARVAPGRRWSCVPSAGLHASAARRQNDPSPAERHRPRRPERTQAEELIESADTVEQLLQLPDRQKVTGNQAAAALIRLCGMVVGEKPLVDTVTQDPRFQQLLNTIDSQISVVWNGNLIGLLRSLFAIGLDANNPVLRSVETEVHWRLRRLTFRNLISLVDFYTSSARSEHQKLLLSDLVKHVELRWAEISHAKDVALLMIKLGHLSLTLMDKLEDKCLELAEHFTPDDTRKVMLALATQSRRSVPLLRALSYHFMQKHLELKTGVLIDMAFAYGKLNFQQTQVFQRLASELLPRVPELSSLDVMRCTKSFAYLKWLNLPLFEALAQYVHEHCDKMSEVQLCNIIMAFARLNYQPATGEAFFAQIHNRLSGALLEMDPFLLVDLVWSLCILQQVNPLYLSHALKPQFYQRITEGTQSQRRENYKLKLVHINATARLQCPEYGGPFLPRQCLYTWVSGGPFLPRQCLYTWVSGGKKKSRPMSAGVREALQSALGDPAKYRCDVDTAYGWVIDGEVLMDSESKPLAVQDYTASHALQPRGTTPLPPGAKRLALVTREFPNYTSRSKELLGRFAMSRRHLQAAGFLVVDVPYYDWLELKSEWQKVAYLKDKMSKAIGEEMAQ